MNLREKLVRLAYYALASKNALPVMERLTLVSERRILRELLSKLRIDCVIDVGANEGQYARLVRRLGFKGLILSFEPNLDAFRVAQRAFAKDGAWRGYNCALGSADGEKDLNVFEHSPLASLFPPSDRLHSRIIQTTKVAIRRLDTLLPKILPDWTQRRLFVKCDTQGFDVEVMRGAEAALAVIAGLQSEISVLPLYRGMPSYLEALSFYESLGFTLVDLWLVTRTPGGDALEYDCLMKRAG
jgi:FkbM family methyltransferase